MPKPSKTIHVVKEYEFHCVKAINNESIPKLLVEVPENCNAEELDEYIFHLLAKVIADRYNNKDITYEIILS